MADDVLCLPGEIWKPDFWHGDKGIEASSLGRIRIGERMVFHNRKIRPQFKRIRARILKQRDSAYGYRITGTTVDGQPIYINVHRSVCAAFHGAPSEGRNCACHGNADRRDNRPENLRWGSHLENSADALAQGRTARGERAGGAKLTRAEVHLIRDAGGGTITKMALSRQFGVSPSHITRIQLRESRASD